MSHGFQRNVPRRSNHGVPVTTSEPLKAPGSPCVSYIADPPQSVGKVGYIPAPLLDHKAPPRLPLGPLEHHLAISTLLPLPCPSPGCVLRAATSQGSGRCPPLQILPLKGGLPSLHAPRPALISIQAQLHCLFPTPFFCLNWKLLTSLPGQQTPHPDSSTPRSFQTCTWMAALGLRRQTFYPVVPS